jgi:hypothetical protein
MWGPATREPALREVEGSKSGLKNWEKIGFVSGHTYDE